MNPFAHAQVTPSRIHQGVEYSGTGPIDAFGTGRVVLTSSTDSGWGNGNGWVSYQPRLRELRPWLSHDLFTSASDPEGKSSTVSNLAVAPARAGRRVVLIDADLRRPNLHDAFALDETPGLTEVELGDAEFEDAGQPIHIADATVAVDGAKRSAHQIGSVEVLPAGQPCTIRTSSARSGRGEGSSSVRGNVRTSFWSMLRRSSSAMRSP